MKSLSICAFAVVAACDRSYPPTLPSQGSLDTIAQAIDKLRWYADAYGGAAMSSPVLVQPDGAFKFGLTMTADQFFASERDQIEGRAAGALASASVLGASIGVSVDATAAQTYGEQMADYRRAQRISAQKQALLNEAARRQYDAAMLQARQQTDAVARANAEADAARQLAASLSGPAADATPTLPTPPAPPALPTATAVSNAAAGLLPALAGTQALYGSNTPAVTGDNRTAILMAAGDVATSAMLSALLDPAKVSNFTGRQVLWGVSMISVTPGWKTRHGYAADLDGTIQYSWVWARPEVRDAFLAQTNTKSVIEAHALEELQRCVIDSMPFPVNEARPLEAVDIKARRKANLTAPEPSDGAAKKFSEADADSLAQTWTRDRLDSRAKENAWLSASFGGVAYGPYLLKSLPKVQPVVAAASPMGDSQALDLQASTRSIREQALQMAFALTKVGMTGQANAFLGFAKSRQLDVETHTRNVVVSPHSATDGHFGFRFNPRLAADPGAGSADDALQVPTFPTLLVVGLSNNDLHPRVAISDGRCYVAEPRLTFMTSTRWSRVGAQCPSGANPDSPCYGQELTEEELMRAAVNAEAVLSKADGSSRTVATLNARLENLLSVVAGDDQALWLPLEVLVPPGPKSAKPAVALAVPNEIILELGDEGVIKSRSVEMTIAGTDLDQIDVSKVASPGPAVTAKLVDKNLVLTFTVDQPGSYAFLLTAKDGTTLATPPLLVRAPNVIAISRKTTDKNGPTTNTILYTTGAPADVVKSEIEKNKVFPADVKVNMTGGVSAGTGSGHPQ